MNILYINPGMPIPGEHDSMARSYALLEQVSRYHSVTVVAFNSHRHSPSISSLNQFCDSYYQIQQKRASLTNVLRAYFSSVPRPFFVLNHKTMRNTVSLLLSEQHFDVIHCGHASLLPVIPSENTVPVLLQQDSINPEAFIKELHKLLAYQGAIRSQELLGINAFLHQTWAEVDGVLVRSQDAKNEILTHAPKANVYIAPPGVDADYFINKGGILADKAIVYAADLRVPENEEAILNFVRSSWRLLHRREPELRLFIIGPKPSSEILRLNKLKNIYVAADIADYHKIVREATIVIFPHHTGSQVADQVLEVLAQCKAVVATRFAVDGLHAIHGENILIADNDAQFIEHIVRLLKDDYERKVMGVQARAVVEAYHTWEYIAHELLSAYQYLVQFRKGVDLKKELLLKQAVSEQVEVEKFTKKPAVNASPKAASPQKQASRSV